MDINRFKQIILEIKNSFNENKKTIEEVFQQELENGYMLSFDECIKEIKRVEDDIVNEKINEENNKNIAIIYNGSLEATINIIITSIYFNNKVDFYGDGCDLARTVIVELINLVLKDEFKIINNYSIIIEKWDEHLKENEDKYDKIVYIGDYFEYDNVKALVKKDIQYNSYGFLKAYIGSLKYQKNHRELAKKSYKNNIYIEYYSDRNDFIENVTENDTVVICENIEEISKKIKAKNILTSEEFLNNYKFSYI